MAPKPVPSLAVVEVVAMVVAVDGAMLVEGAEGEVRVLLLPLNLLLLLRRGTNSW